MYETEGIFGGEDTGLGSAWVRTLRERKLKEKPLLNNLWLSTIETAGILNNIENYLWTFLEEF